MATLLPNGEVGADALKGYRIFLFSRGHPHPAHVHFQKGKQVSGWDIATIMCIDPDGFHASGTGGSAYKPDDASRCDLEKLA